MKLLLTSTSTPLVLRILHVLLDQDLLPPSDIAISTISPWNISPLAKQNSIEVLVQGDFTLPVSQLAEVFASTGAEILFLASSSTSSSEQCFRNAVDAAVGAGCINLIVYSYPADGEYTTTQGRIVEYLAQQHHDSGVEYIVLRQGVCAEKLWTLHDLGDGQSHDGEEEVEIILPIDSADNAIAWICLDDLAEGIARILAHFVANENEAKNEWVGKTLDLTGSRVVKIANIAGLVEKVTGRRKSIRFTYVEREEARKYYLKNLMRKREREGAEEEEQHEKEEGNVENWLRWFDKITREDFTLVDPLLGDVLEREPNGMEEAVRNLVDM